MIAEIFIAICILLGIFLAWLFGKQRKLSGLLKFGCVLCICASASCGQEEKQAEIIILSEKPMALPADAMQTATAGIADSINESDHLRFLSDWWPIPLNNSTGEWY